MLGWFRERKKFEKDTNIMINALTGLIQEHIIAIDEIQKAVKELKDVQRTLSDDMYDVQADLTLIHNIEGYEDWRSEIGKPVSKPTDIVK